MSAMENGPDLIEREDIEVPSSYLGSALLAVAIAAILASAVCLVGDSLLVNFVGYALASIVAFGCIAGSRRVEVRRSLETGIGTDTRVSAISVGVLVAGLVLAVVNAWLIARHYG